MRRALVVLLLAGCAPTPTEVTAGCSRDVEFWRSWPCERANTLKSPNPKEFKDYYVAIGNVVAERSMAGSITNAEADLVMAKAVVEVNSAIRASRPTTVVVPVPYAQPQAVGPSQISCYRVGSFTSCY